MLTGKHNADTPPRVRLAECQALEILKGSEDLRARFWAKVNRRGACWLWTGGKYGGNHSEPYGQFAVTVAPRRQVGVYAHRVAWALSHEVGPDALRVLHHCDTPLCCNPDHLFLGTHADNMQDAAKKGRLHVVRPKNHRIATSQLAEIDALLARGVLKVDIARQYGVSKAWVSLYAKGERRQYDRPAHHAMRKAG